MATYPMESTVQAEQWLNDFRSLNGREPNDLDKSVMASDIQSRVAADTYGLMLKMNCKLDLLAKGMTLLINEAKE